MRFNDHSDLAGKHAFLSASNNHWLNYDDDKLVSRFYSSMDAAHGTRLHAFAAEAILLKHRFPRNNQTLNRYVNDAISYDMYPEQTLYYSENAFGTADAIRHYEDKELLRIHDLKTGKTKVTMTQLETYTSFFCLEYKIKPSTLEIILRVYQNDDVYEHRPELEKIVWIMDRIVTADKILREIKKEYLPY